MPAHAATRRHTPPRARTRRRAPAHASARLHTPPRACTRLPRAYLLTRAAAAPPCTQISTYHGTPLYKEEISSGFDTSYVVRVPNSGGALIDGKPYADAIRANPANPTAEGTYLPVEGAAEWERGAACMANDPRDKKRNNALLTFVKPDKAVAKALRDLALLRPQLVATRDIEVGEEVFYSYGSDKPFEHILKTLQAQQQQQKKGDRGAILEGNPEGCKLVWVTHKDYEHGNY